MRDECGRKIVAIERAAVAENADRLPASRPLERDVVAAERLRGEFGACGARCCKRRLDRIALCRFRGTTNGARPCVKSEDATDERCDRVGRGE